MKIAYLIHSTFNSGGMERVLSNKCNALARAGLDVTIITTDQTNKGSFFTLEPSITSVDLDINYSSTRYSGFFKKLICFFGKRRRHKARLSKILFDEKFDIVVSMFGNEVHWLTDIQDGSKKILEIHFSKSFREQANRNGLLWLSDVYRSNLDERAVIKYDKFIVLTDEDKQLWAKNKNITRIYNSVSIIPEEISSLDSNRAIAVGRLTYQKGFDRLIDIWNIVNQKHPNWCLDIYGSGEDYEALHNQITRLNLNDVVTIHQPTSDILSEINSSSMLLMTSNYEGLPMVLLESMSCGVPPIAFDCKCGPRDIITDGKSGFLVNDGDIETFATRVCELIENSELRQSMGIAARQDAIDRFSEDVIIKQWKELFKSIKTHILSSI
ncbi:MAG: glycosyltransferase family 4 protein [Rikenellaceae bacterium]